MIACVNNYIIPFPILGVICPTSITSMINFNLIKFFNVIIHPPRALMILSDLEEVFVGFLFGDSLYFSWKFGLWYSEEEIYDPVS